MGDRWQTVPYGKASGKWRTDPAANRCAQRLCDSKGSKVHRNGYGRSSEHRSEKCTGIRKSIRIRGNVWIRKNICTKDRGRTAFVCCISFRRSAFTHCACSAVDPQEKKIRPGGRIDSIERKHWRTFPERSVWNSVSES